jgi:hypothetical protein
MYNALSGVGGGGQVDSTTAAKSNVALSSVGAVCNIFVAPVVLTLLDPNGHYSSEASPMYFMLVLCYATLTRLMSRSSLCQAAFSEWVHHYFGFRRVE